MTTLAKDYVAVSEKQIHDVSNLIEEFEEILKNISGNCIDVGCGPGNITNDILLPALSANAKLIGTDISPDMIEYANNVYSSKVKFEILDIETKNLPHKYISNYDYVFSFYALHFCCDLQHVYNNIYKMIRPGGGILLMFASFHGSFLVCDILSRRPEYEAYAQIIRRFISSYYYSTNALKECKTMLRKAGFEIQHCSHRAMHFAYKNPDNIIIATNSLFDILFKDIPKNTLDKFKVDFKKEYINNHIIFKDEENRENLLDQYKLLIVHGKKPSSCA